MKKLLLGGFVAIVLGAAAAHAADMPGQYPVYPPPPPPAPIWVWEAGGRYWYSSARNAYNYYVDPTPALVVSRLTYDGLTAHLGEAFGRLDGPVGFFLKGYLGGGSIAGGHLYDEDFPSPSLSSKTVSNTKGALEYADIDAGFSFYDGRAVGSAPMGPGVRLGGFVGYHYWHERVDAFGCNQIGGGTVCAGPGSPSIPPSVKGVTEDDQWNALRIGGVADIWFSRVLKFTAEAAYARVWQSAVDTHYFTFGSDPATGNGNGVQLEVVLSYQVTDLFNVGIGGRWWHYSTSAIDQFDQLLKYTTDRYGGFIQGSLKFGEPAGVAN